MSVVAVGLLVSPACAAEPTAAAPLKVDTGDTAWVMLGAALVMLMTPGLAFFYGGLVRRKNVLSVLMQCFMILCLISIQWMLFGYSLAFGPDAGGHGIIGDLSWAGLNGVGAEPFAAYSKTVPHQVFMIFQMMFAVITPALIIGAFAERIRFSAFCVFSLLWTTLVYDPVAHWVWSADGFMGVLRTGGWGALDVAGGTVVHINAGMAALAAALYLGRRQGFPDKMSPPHNLPFAVLGAALLWFGWFGFNAGSALSANGLAGSAFVSTHIASAAAGLTWALLDWIKHRKPTTLGIITGAVGGLVAITPAAGYVTPMGAVLVGVGAGVFPWLAVTYIKVRMGYDDSLDAFGVHGVGGIWGAIATGLFATIAVNESLHVGGGCGLFYDNYNPAQLLTQIKAVGLTMGYSFVMSFGLFWLVDKFFKLRVTDHEERVGLDLTQHKEAGYTVID
ncbi:MAG: ammonium transporter [Planctomycetaceae bacterium]|nr:MAG: ammonium transporter [Planctomycetaceae bacterium]